MICILTFIIVVGIWWNAKRLEMYQDNEEYGVEGIVEEWWHKHCCCNKTMRKVLFQGGRDVISWFDPLEYCKYFIFAVNKKWPWKTEKEKLKGIWYHKRGKVRGYKGVLCLKTYTICYLKPSLIPKSKFANLKEVKRIGGNKFINLSHHFIKISKLSSLHSWH